ncbi:PDR/VanB family oxidoreductase [Ramlibacter sp. 2FC]|uniref:PDR/VanB family oxidoreductase n=1 Tax=Ramlibacter sp. 2FC TaxID=2502188 RepID=UPI0010F96F1D|nr:PDR/VanB family oxidoreductase [Ramlibacter sp. 2FC]
METIQVQVAQVQTINPLIRCLTLSARDGSALPGFSAGAHVRVQVALADGASDWRHYSLIDLGGDPAAAGAPAQYRIAVRREDEGRGGSRFMHALQAGDSLTIEPPRNDFPLGQHPGRTVLVAGGIGVTPLIGMAAQCRAQGRPVTMVYAGHSRELMAFLPELQGLLGDGLAVHADTEAGAPLDVAALIEGCGASDRLYVCGPKPMLDAVLGQAQARGWPSERVHFELFSAPPAQAGDHAFELVLAQSGKSCTVPADQTILDCLIDQGCDPLFDCKRGECGVCAVPVIEGEVDHRDYVLSAGEKAAGKLIQICISRAKGRRLVLDL